MSEPSSPSVKNGFIKQVIGNTSLLAAMLIYTGWSWLNAQLGYFHLSPITLNISNLDYILHGTFLFIPNIIFVVVVIILGIVLYSRAPILARLIPSAVKNSVNAVPHSRLKVGLGVLITIAAGLLAWSADHVDWLFGTWTSRNPVFFSLVILLLGAGPVLLVWPNRSHGYGHFLYPVAIVVAASCAIWAAGVYAANRGTETAEYEAHNIAALSSVAVYSIQRLAISGPGITVESLPGGYIYHYRYIGLNLLYTQSGTYYLLPIGWTRTLGTVYILNDSDQIRIEVYAGAPAPVPVPAPI